MRIRFLFALLTAYWFLNSCNSWNRSAMHSHSLHVGDSSLYVHNESEMLIRPYRDSLSRSMREVIGRTTVELYTAKPQGPLGNFICDLLMEDIPAQTEYAFLKKHNCFSLLNTRGLRASIPAGDITIEKIYSVMPFENEIVLVKMPFSSIERIGAALTAAGAHPLSANTTLVAFSGEYAGLIIEGARAQEEVWIITTDYLADGGDGMQFFEEQQSIIRTGIKLRDAIIAHIRKKNQEGKTIQSANDDRILFFR